MSGPAAAYWAEALGRWAIPQEILSAAPESPFGFPPELFLPSGEVVDTPSRSRALEALGEGGSVADIGAGGGAAGLALVPPASRLTAVDQSPEMLEALRSVAGRHPGLNLQTIVGRWPEVSGELGEFDVVVCHNVLYNVAHLEPFLAELDRHASRRVVIQITQRHPRALLSAMWRHFWGVALPEVPMAEDAAAVAAEMGFDAHLELFDARIPSNRDRDVQIRFLRRQLCLGPDADAEIDSMLGKEGIGPRPSACIWWDTATA